MGEAKIVLVVAVSENGVIGRDGDLPWRLPSDLKRFKQLTLGKPILMGRRTWQSIGRPLPGRPNIVVTRDAAFAPEGAHVAGSLEEGMALARRYAGELGTDEICIVGGGDIYRQVFDRADIIHVTYVGTRIDGDTYFPDIDPERFAKVVEEEIPQAANDSHSMRFATWERKKAA